MSVLLDATRLATGWLSVAQATGNDRERPALWRTICIEQHAHGLRLTATDSYMILTTWVADQEHEYDTNAEPSLDELPMATAVAIDEHGRAAGLLAHLRRLAKELGKETGDAVQLDAVVRLNVPWQPETEESGGMQLDGMQAVAVTIEHPDHERVQLSVFDANWVHWQHFVQSAKRVRTDSIGVSADVATRLAKAARVHGEAAVIKHWFGGKDKPITVAFGSEPEVTGMVMPCRWDFERDQPWVAPGKRDDDEDGDQ